jgi:hypothetical protein
VNTFYDQYDYNKENIEEVNDLNNEKKWKDLKICDSNPNLIIDSLHDFQFIDENTIMNNNDQHSLINEKNIQPNSIKNNNFKTSNAYSRFIQYKNKNKENNDDFEYNKNENKIGMNQKNNKNKMKRFVDNKITYAEHFHNLNFSNLEMNIKMHCDFINKKMNCQIRKIDDNITHEQLKNVHIFYNFKSYIRKMKTIFNLTEEQITQKILNIKLKTEGEIIQKFKKYLFKSSFYYCVPNIKCDIIFEKL